MNQFHRTVLEGVKADIQRGGVWICNSVNRVSRFLDEDHKIAADEIKDAIEALLYNEKDGCSDTLVGWVNVYTNDEGVYDDHDDMRATRLAWIDYMLENW